MLAAFGQEHREILGNLIHVPNIGRNPQELDRFGAKVLTRSQSACAIRQLEQLRRQHKIASALPPRRVQPPRISVLQPGRRRAARRFSSLARVLIAAAVVGVVVTVVLTLG
jgi:hypothetical protein